MTSTTAPPTSPWAARRCPGCRATLDGGPIRDHCRPCGQAWYAADINNETVRSRPTSGETEDDHRTGSS